MRILKKGGLLFVILVCVIWYFMETDQSTTVWQEITDADKAQLTMFLADDRPDVLYFPTCIPEGMYLNHAETKTGVETETVECYFEKLTSVRKGRLDFSPPELETESLWFLQSNDPSYIAKQSGMEEGQTLQSGTYEFHDSEFGNTLCWTEGNLTCILRGKLSEEDLTKIAQSIQAV